MTPIASQSVAPPRVLECPVQLEAVLAGQHKVAEDDERLRGGVIVFEVRVQRVYAQQSLLVDGEPNRIDPDKWRPLIMSFQKFYGLAPGQIHEPTLAKIRRLCIAARMLIELAQLLSSRKAEHSQG